MPDGSNNEVTGKEIAIGIQTIMDYCTNCLVPEVRFDCGHGGQLFDTNYWNLIVKGRVQATLPDTSGCPAGVPGC